MTADFNKADRAPLLLALSWAIEHAADRKPVAGSG